MAAIALKPVDRVEILSVMDNSIDVLMGSTPVARRVKQTLLFTKAVSAVMLKLQGKPALKGIELLFQGALGSRWSIEDCLLKAITWPLATRLTANTSPTSPQAEVR